MLHRLTHLVARRSSTDGPPRCKRKRLGTSLAALAFSLSASGAALAAGPRAVSINLCTDQFLISLADPDQVLGLSPYARDPARSWAAEAARHYPLLSGTAEEVLVLKPDLVLAGRYTKRATRDLLKTASVHVEEFDAAGSIADVRQQVLRAGTLLGHPDRAAAQVTALDAAVARSRAVAAATPLSVLPLQRRGWVSGRQTLTTSLLDAVGLRNAGAVLSGRGKQVSLEAIVALRPDLLLLSGEGRAEDQGSALLLHPALQGLVPPERRIVLPEMLTVCGGPMLAEALDRLAAAVTARR